MGRPADPNRRAAILVAARDAFNARGFAATRMEDIARALGLSKAALYLQFTSKQHLFEAVTSELIEAMLPQLVPDHFGDMPADQLLRLFVAGASQRLCSPEMAFVPRVIIGEGMNFPELARFYHDHMIRRGLGIVAGIIRHGIARGEMTCADPDLVARSVVGGVLLGALWRITFEPVGADPLDVAAFARSHADVLLNGLVVREEAKP